MAENNKTPLWLDLRKEYIDDNFEKLQSYLAGCASSVAKRDSFYDTTIELLRARIDDLLTTVTARPIFQELEDRKQITFNTSLLATYLLADGGHTLALPAYVAFMAHLCVLNPRLSDRIISAAVKRLRYENVTNLGFGWKDLDKIGSELFAHNASTLAKFDVPLRTPLIYTKHGSAYISKDGVFLTHDTTAETKKVIKSGANSLDTGIGIALRTPTADKLKQSADNNLSEMDEFTKDFIKQQYKVQNKKVTVQLKNYDENDETVVRITEIDAYGTIHVETADHEYHKLSGTIQFDRPSLFYYNMDSLHLFLKVGDYLPATVRNVDKPTFNIEKQLTNFFVEDTKAAYEERNEFLAKLIDERDTNCRWITEFGEVMFTVNNHKYNRGDFAFLSVRKFHYGDYYGKIDANIEGDADIDFDERTARHDCIRAFAQQTAAPVEAKQEEATSELSPMVINLLMKQLFAYQRRLLKPSDRFRFLANASVMAEMIGDDLSASYIKFTRTYLRALVQFVLNEDMSEIQLNPEDDYRDAKATQIRLKVIDLLKEYGRKDDSKLLADTIQDYKEQLPMLSRLARLIQTANSMQDTLSGSALNVIKREIIKTLSIETENDADLEADGGTYLGIESGTQEFKTSIIYPSNNNMQPDEYTQTTNVLKGVCAFLNSTTGGVLYLGVNDQGYVTGLENDMKYLKQTSIDSYLRYVQDAAKKHFGIDTLPYLRIEPLYDNRVVAIHVEPHPYRVVELNNTAYLRVNAESREMPENVRQQLIARKVFTNKNQAAAISLLQHACSQKKCVVLHNYASSNSGKVADRLVEAYDVKPEDGLVMCYDRKKLENGVFKINRIGYVEILENEPWVHTAAHKKINVDVFHMSGTKPIPVSLQLDLFAKNLLIEEFPSSKEFIKPHKGDDNIWYFDTNIYQVEGLARFYIGLANHIKILKAPELEKFIASFVKDNLQAK